MSNLRKKQEGESRFADRGTAQRMKDSREVHRRTGDPRRAIAAYCSGNRWLEENARAVGNWPQS